MGDTTEQDRVRLGETVSKRRRELGLSVSAAARLAGIDRATWTGIERGNRRTEAYNYAGAERALGWASGSVDAILSGGAAVATVRSDVVPVTDDETLAREVERIRGLGGVSPESRLRMIRAIVDLYEERSRRNA